MGMRASVILNLDLVGSKTLQLRLKVSCLIRTRIVESLHLPSCVNQIT